MDRILAELWSDFITLNPRAGEVHALLTGMGETVVNDHIAFRGLSSPHAGIAAIASHFLRRGYAWGGDYAFPDKHVIAAHLDPPDPALPKVFVSELQYRAFSPRFQAIVCRMLSQIPRDHELRTEMLWSGATWSPVSYAEYEALAAESEYGAWVSAFGTRANHFTVLLNGLSFTQDIRAFNALIASHGYRLNAAGGEVKGSPAVFLEQSSIMAPEVPYPFSDGTRAIPGCFYEFAKRYPLPDGTLFQGFVEASANRIFESTDR